MTQSFSWILAPCTPISAKVWAGLTGVTWGLVVEGGGSVASSVVAVATGVERVVAVAVVGVGTGVSSFKFSRIRSTLPTLLFVPDAGGRGASLLPLPFSRPPTGGGGVLAFLPLGLSVRYEEDGG